MEVSAANDKEDATEPRPRHVSEWELDARGHGAMTVKETERSIKLARREQDTQKNWDKRKGQWLFGGKQEWI